MNNRMLVLALGFAGFALLPGCGPRQTGPTILESRAQPYIFDVPVPRKFELDRRRSTHDQSEGKRAIHHLYVGSDTPLAAKNFYRQKMPENGWQLMEEQLKTGVYFLKYKNAEENCDVRIEEIPAGFGGTKTQISVEIKRRA